eukprot:scaffold55517_cov63-Phaeocystis_antarctica.AAC.1
MTMAWVTMVMMIIVRGPASLWLPWCWTIPFREASPTSHGGPGDDTSRGSKLARKGELGDA